MCLVLGFGLEHSCPWPRECLSSERLSLALASDFFLCPWPCVLDSTSVSLVSSIPVLGLERVCPRKGCPWPWRRIFFCSLGLGLKPCVLDFTTSGTDHQKHLSKKSSRFKRTQVQVFLKVIKQNKQTIQSTYDRQLVDYLHITTTKRLVF